MTFDLGLKGMRRNEKTWRENMVGRKTADKNMLLIDVVKFCIEWQVQDLNLFYPKC